MKAVKREKRKGKREVKSADGKQPAFSLFTFNFSLLSSGAQR